MAFKLVVIFATLAYASAGVLQAPAAISTYAAAPAISYPGAAAISYHGAPALAAPLSYQTPALTSQSSNIYRSYGNLGQISTYSKTVDTPYSSVSKSDVRVSNPGLRIASTIAAPAFAAAPAIAAAPAYAPAPAVIAARSYATPAVIAARSYGAPAVAAPGSLLGVAYSAAPAVAHMNYVSAYANYHF